MCRRLGAIGKDLARALPVLRIAVPQHRGDELAQEVRFPIRTQAEQAEMTDLETSGQDIIVFRSTGSERLRVLYRRRDGHFGLVEPEF